MYKFDFRIWGLVVKSASQTSRIKDILFQDTQKLPALITDDDRKKKHLVFTFWGLNKEVQSKQHQGFSNCCEEMESA